MSDDIGERLREIVEAFIKNNEISCGEAIYQTDRVSENALELIEELCEVVGYHEYPEDE